MPCLEDLDEADSDTRKRNINGRTSICILGLIGAISLFFIVFFFIFRRPCHPRVNPTNYRTEDAPGCLRTRYRAGNHKGQGSIEYSKAPRQLWGGKKKRQTRLSVTVTPRNVERPRRRASSKLVWDEVRR